MSDPIPTEADRVKARAIAGRCNRVSKTGWRPTDRWCCASCRRTEQILAFVAASWLDGVRAGIEAAAKAVDDTAGQLMECDYTAAMIRALDPTRAQDGAQA